MPTRCALFSTLVLLLLRLPAHAAVPSDWTTPIAPFQIADNLYYVGSRDLAAYLVVTPAGDILINANYTSSPALIRHSVEQLGYHWNEIKLLLISHAHVDHAGGAAAILKQTGAQYEVMDGDVDVVESGGQSDFAFGHQGTMQFPRAHVQRTLHDGDTVTLGGTILTAHRTPGHTRGCTTWTLRTHLPGDPAGVLRDAVLVGSWYALPSYRLTDRPGKPASYPGIATDFRKGFAVLHALPCDLFLGAHGSYFDMLAKLKRLPTEGAHVWIDPQGYRRALAAAEAEFQAKYSREVAAGGKSS